jgi:uncharacterized protein (DUF488 family)
VGFLLLYDVGYGALKCLEELLTLLKTKGVKVLVDLRAFPRSRIKGFNREELEEELRKNGVKYLWLGDKLGGFRKGGYEKYLQSDGFREGIEALLSVARNEGVCLMCLERDRRFCHRRFIVEALKEVEIEVRDLVRDP